ncbi:hypothetical protein HN51_059816 [Arachis hypogaea]|uniref:Uncharacterized protein n=1 Tax=Arachis hypogaea TaxID=3818 RepID=A0A445B420_ARAHY|nr:uncharacterized protein LOC107621553 isoform X1 [Arachis ipaensis]XP_025623869.1 uncharacterized protein LOC112716219 isoform X1 [Arachis hypogaea]XP_025683776.1 uncharacterized protein LOC112784695 isoform X1 [Arachis hypogaea]XP_057736938.1 uncharacterized protein LOC130954226 isoform X1 [Arachis stenosperma]QHN83296.1 uncharacterized protein DS421_20g703540 [Arachis hypogaea]QHO16942.1 uncharacterized protein DS421_10g307960 [Arachis hypogaea]RYQ85555.1 hypothetical protein Ahy_B10g1051
MVVGVPTRDSHKRNFAVAVAAVFAMLAKRASRLPKKLKAAAESEPKPVDDWKIVLRSSPKSSPAAALVARPKKLLSSLSSKTLSFIQKKNNKSGGEWGDGGVWQKAILMGDKCEPLDFSGVIYYDSNGKQVSEIPVRSPRASHVPAPFFTPQRQLLKRSVSSEFF